MLMEAGERAASQFGAFPSIAHGHPGVHPHTHSQLPGSLSKRSAGAMPPPPSHFPAPELDFSIEHRGGGIGSSLENSLSSYPHPQGVDGMSMVPRADDASRGSGVNTPMFIPGIQDHYVGVTKMKPTQEQQAHTHSSLQMDCSGSPSDPNAWGVGPLLSTKVTGHAGFETNQPDRVAHFQKNQMTSDSFPHNLDTSMSTNPAVFSSRQHHLQSNAVLDKWGHNNAPGSSPSWTSKLPSQNSPSWIPESAFQGSPEVHDNFKPWSGSSEDGAACTGVFQQSFPIGSDSAADSELWRGLPHAEVADIMMPTFLNKSAPLTMTDRWTSVRRNTVDEPGENLSDQPSSDGGSSIEMDETEASLMRIMDDGEPTPRQTEIDTTLSTHPERSPAPDSLPPFRLACQVESRFGPPVLGGVATGGPQKLCTCCGGIEIESLQTLPHKSTTEGSVSTVSGLSSSRESSENSYTTTGEAPMNARGPLLDHGPLLAPPSAPPSFPSPPLPEAISGLTSLVALDLPQAPQCNEPILNSKPMHPPGVWTENNLPEQHISSVGGHGMGARDLVADLDSNQLKRLLWQRLQLEEAMTPCPSTPAPALPPPPVFQQGTNPHAGVPPAPPLQAPTVESVPPPPAPPQGFAPVGGIARCVPGRHHQVPANAGMQPGTAWEGLSIAQGPTLATAPLARCMQPPPAAAPAAHMQPDAAVHRAVQQNQQPPADGSQISEGTAGHPYSCALACKFFGTARGCKDGVKCPHCHVCPWKRRYRTARGKVEAMKRWPIPLQGESTRYQGHEPCKSLPSQGFAQRHSTWSQVDSQRRNAMNGFSEMSR